MKDSDMIELCLGIACKAHKGQIDKVGLPVILHPIHVGEMGNSTEEICVGFLHDTIEDTDMTYDKLLSLGVRKDIADSVCILTHKEGVPYFDYVQSIIDSKIWLQSKSKSMTCITTNREPRSTDSKNNLKNVLLRLHDGKVLST